MLCTMWIRGWVLLLLAAASCVHVVNSAACDPLCHEPHAVYTYLGMTGETFDFQISTTMIVQHTVSFTDLTGYDCTFRFNIHSGVYDHDETLMNEPCDGWSWNGPLGEGMPYAHNVAVTLISTTAPCMPTCVTTFSIDAVECIDNQYPAFDDPSEIPSYPWPTGTTTAAHMCSPSTPWRIYGPLAPAAGDDCYPVQLKIGESHRHETLVGGVWVTSRFGITPDAAAPNCRYRKFFSVCEDRSPYAETQEKCSYALPSVEYTYMDVNPPTIGLVTAGVATLKCSSFPLASALDDASLHVTVTDDCFFLEAEYWRGTGTWGEHPLQYAYFSQVPSSCHPVEDFTLEVFATDPCGNASPRVNITFNVVDTTPPVFDPIPSPVVIGCGESTDPIDVGIPTARDECGDVLITPTYTDMEMGCSFPNLIIHRTWTAVDACGNQETAIQELHVDTGSSPPTISITPSPATRECDDRYVFSATFSDDCMNATQRAIVTSPPTMMPCELTGPVTYSVSVDDGCQSDLGGITITYIDTTPPDLTPLPMAVVECGNSTDPSATGTSSASDNCDSMVPVTFQDLVSLSPCGLPEIDRTWNANDCTGNSAQFVQSIVVQDTVPPYYTAPLLNQTIECGTPLPPQAPPASDTCDSSVSHTVEEGIASGTCFPEWAMRQYIATDCSGNTISITQEFTFEDTLSPVFVPPLPKSMTLEVGDSGMVPSATDMCDSSLLVTWIDHEPFSVTSCGIPTFQREYIATDCSGNFVAQNVTVTNVDLSPPVFVSFPPDITTSCSESEPMFTGTPTANDSTAVVLTFDDTVQDTPCLPLVAATKTIVRTWTATDCIGLSVTRNQTITVVDMDPPEWVAPLPPTDVYYECGIGDAWDGVYPTATDECGSTLNVTANDTTSPTACPGVVTIERTWTASDCYGNSNVFIQTIHGQDTLPPLVVSPKDVDLECGTSFILTPPIAADACDPHFTVELGHDAPVSFTCGNKLRREQQFTWTVNDCSGNGISTDLLVRYFDTLPPLWTGNDTVVVECTADLESDLAVAPVPMASDVCGGKLWTTVEVGDHGSNACGLGTITRNFTAYDCGGNNSTFTQKITRVDTTPPRVAIPTNVEFGCTEATEPVDHHYPVATDNCSPTLSMWWHDGPSSPTGVCGLPRWDRWWNVTDCALNSEVVKQTVTVIHDQAPQVIVPGASAGECGLSQGVAVHGTANATDGCSGTSIPVAHEDQIVEGECGQHIIVRLFTAVDCMGGGAAAQQVIEVADTRPPYWLVFPADVSMDVGDSTDAAHTGIALAGDDCGLEVAVEHSDSFVAAEQCGDRGVGTWERSWTATDCVGHTTTQIQTISVTSQDNPCVPVGTDGATPTSIVQDSGGTERVTMSSDEEQDVFGDRAEGNPDLTVLRPTPTPRPSVTMGGTIQTVPGQRTEIVDGNGLTIGFVTVGEEAVLILQGPDPQVLDGASTEEDVYVASAVVDISYADPSMHVNAEICLYVRETVDKDHACLGFVDRYGQWRCQDSCMKDGSEIGFVCGVSDHFTHFGVLLGAGIEGACGGNDALITGTWWGDIVLFCCTIGFVCFICTIFAVVGDRNPRLKSFLKGEESNDVLEKYHKEEMEMMSQETQSGDAYYDGTM